MNVVKERVWRGEKSICRQTCMQQIDEKPVWRTGGPKAFFERGGLIPGKWGGRGRGGGADTHFLAIWTIFFG